MPPITTASSFVQRGSSHYTVSTSIPTVFRFTRVMDAKLMVKYCLDVEGSCYHLAFGVQLFGMCFEQDWDEERSGSLSVGYKSVYSGNLKLVVELYSQFGHQVTIADLCMLLSAAHRPDSSINDSIYTSSCLGKGPT